MARPLSKGAKLIILGVLLVIVDQITKVLVKTNMDLGQQIYVIGEWFRICFVENEGMAFGMAFGGWVGKLLLSLFRIVLFGGLVWWISKLDYAPFMFGKVVDMLYFPLIRDSFGQTIFFQPVFNVADSCVTVGAFYLILFQWRFFSGKDSGSSAEETEK